MTANVYYYTRSGNTKKLADAVAAALGIDSRDVSVPLRERTDILFLGSSLYAFGFDPAVGEFIIENAAKIGTLVCFGTSASGASTYKKVRALAESCGIAVYEKDFRCPGHFLALHKGRPDDADLAAVATFAKEAIAAL